MARDYKNARRTPSANKGAPGWVWFSVGLTMGLFVAVLVFLYGYVPQPSTTTAHRSADGNTTARTEKAAKAAASSNEVRSVSTPRFDFYTILPEREVRVPEHELAPPRRRSTASAASPGRYMLQVGSFRKLAEADRLKASLALIGLQADIQTVAINGGDRWHRVRLGPYASVQMLNETRAQLRAHRMEAIILKDKD